MDLTVRATLGPTDELAEEIGLGEGKIIDLQVLDRLVMQEAVGLVEGISLRATLGKTDGLTDNIGLGEAIIIDALGLVDGISVRSLLGPTDGLAEEIDLGEAIRIKLRVLDQLVIQEALGVVDGFIP